MLASAAAAFFATKRSIFERPSSKASRLEELLEELLIELLLAELLRLFRFVRLLRSLRPRLFWRRALFSRFFLCPFFVGGAAARAPSCGEGGRLLSPRRAALGRLVWRFSRGGGGGVAVCTLRGVEGGRLLSPRLAAAGRLWDGGAAARAPRLLASSCGHAACLFGAALPGACGGRSRTRFFRALSDRRRKGRWRSRTAAVSGGRSLSRTTAFCFSVSLARWAAASCSAAAASRGHSLS